MWQCLLRRLRGGGGSYAAYSVVRHLLTGASGVIVMRWLDPVALGWWNASQMLRLPLDALRGGILSGMNREYPFLTGANEPHKAREVIEAGLAHTLAMIVVSQIAVGAVLFFSSREQPFLFAGLLVSCLIWSFDYYAQFVHSTLRTSHNFRLISQVELGVAVVDSLSVLLVWRYGYYGLLARALLSSVLIAGALFYFQPVRVRPRLHKEALVRMFRFGRHTYLIGYLLLIGSNAERLLLLSVNDGVKLLGLYSPALIGASFLQIIPGAIHSYYYPKVVETFGRDRDEAKLLDAIIAQIRKTTLLMGGVSAAAALGILLLIKLFLPRYTEGLLPSLLVCLAGPFYPMRMCASYFNALHRWPEYYAYTILQVTVPFGAMWALMKCLPPLTAVATGYVISVAVSGGALLWLTFAHAGTLKGAAGRPA